MRLYVIVRNDLSKSQKTVQSVHAAAEFLLKECPSGWDNGTVVCLKAGDENHLKSIIGDLDKNGIKHKYFIEPDLQDSITAVALVSDKTMFKNLGLL